MSRKGHAASRNSATSLVERMHGTGIRRLGDRARGFRYEGSGGGAVSAADLSRIRDLKIPPAWRDVAIHASPRAPVQAVGRDAAGRWQYLYHRAHAARREKRKYERLLRFGRALPAMRARIRRDLKQPGLPREKVLACALQILSFCFPRPGSRVYAEENGSYGLTTLRRRHVAVEGSLIRFDFPGKAGKRQTLQMRDRRVARIVRDLARAPGKVFRYRDESGAWIDVRRRHVNEYIKESMGEAFSAKDFRTWAGTLLCAGALARSREDPSQARLSVKRKIVRAIRETAERLGNTPAICRASYISPPVLRNFERGRVLEEGFDTVEELARSAALHRSEKALLRLLASTASG
ncbi:MAG TPA: DNA topoisomerase IB [Thermoanaerobaculia bacterium]|nr:DNA topoisomerase IB [Thermoanaerobaculia bacterium]